MKNLGFGCMRLPLVENGKGGDVDVAQTCKMFDYYLENGYNYFDTAYFYHDRKGEEIVRECLVKRHPRDSFTITTKMPVMLLKEEEDVAFYFNAQLERLGVDYFDYYWLHGLSKDHLVKADKFRAFDFVKKMKAEGKIKHLGFSFHDKADVLDDILTKHPEMEFVQLQLNYLDWDSPSIQAGKCYEIARKHNKQIIVMEPVKGGKLVNIPNEAIDKFRAYDKDASLASWALRFVSGLEGIYMILSGMSNFEQVVDNVKTFNDLKPLNEEEKKIIEENILIIKKSNRVPCTACRYCMDACPNNIAIPEYFDLANSSRVKKDAYNALVAEGHGKASDCIECGACEQMCPQQLPIRQYLKDIIVKDFEN